MEKDTQFFIYIDNKEAGPFTLDNIMQQGLTRDTLVWFQGQPNWSKAGDIPELNALLEKAAPTTPAAQTAVATDAATAQQIQELQARLAELEKKLAEQQAAPSTSDSNPTSTPSQHEEQAYSGDKDPLFEQCAQWIVQGDSASTSALQRRYQIGYNRAGRIMDQLEAAGIVGPAVDGKPRKVLLSPLELDSLLSGSQPTASPSQQSVNPVSATPPSRPTVPQRPLNDDNKGKSDNSSCLKAFFTIVAIVTILILLAVAINNCHSTTSNQNDYDSVAVDYPYEDVISEEAVEKASEAVEEAAPAVEDDYYAPEAAKEAAPAVDYDYYNQDKAFEAAADVVEGTVEGAKEAAAK